MSVTYFAKMVGGSPYVEILPPTLLNSSWHDGIQSIVTREGKRGDIPWDGTSIGAFFKMTFNNESELEEWVRTHALSDPDLINDVRIWNTTYPSIVHTFEIHHDDERIEPTTLSLIPLE